MRPSCNSAIAYLHPAIPESESVAGAAVEPEDTSAVFRPFAPGLIVSYLVEDGEDYRYVCRGDLLAAEISVDDLHAIAVANLRRCAFGKLEVRPHGEIFAASFGGSFEGSLPLLDELWRDGVRHMVVNDFVVAIPARDILAFCDSGSAEGIAQLRDVVEKIWAVGEHLLTRTLYRRRDATWEPVPD